jgi:flagellin-like protein
MKSFKNFGRRFRRSVRGISPIIAVLLIIVITVAAALVAYAWVMGYMSFTTARVGKAIQIQSIARTEANDVSIWVQNVGDSDVVLSDVYVNDVLTDGALAISLPATETVGIPLSGTHPGLQVKIKVVTVDGTFIEYTKTFTSSTGGDGGVITPPTVTQASSSDTGFGTVEEGDLLVVIPNTRTGTFSTDALTCTADGWTTVEVAAYMDDTSDRRAVAVLIKEAVGDEDGDTVSVTWGGSGVTTYTTIYQVYTGDATGYAKVASDVAHNGGGSSSTSLPTISLPSGSTANVLTIGAAVFRDSPGTVTMTNLGGQDSSVSSNCYTFTEFSYGDAVTETDITWTTARLASGMLVQIACT